MLEEHIKNDARVKICSSRQGCGDYIDEEKNQICQGVITRVISEAELEITLSDNDVEDELQKTVCYVMYIYAAQEVFIGSIYYRSLYQMKEKMILVVEVVSPFEKIQRRMHQRVSCHSKIFFQAVSQEMIRKWKTEPVLFDEYDILSESLEDSLVDISGGGIRFTTKSNIPVNEFLFVRFELMNEKRAVEMKVLGQVVYSKLLRNEQDCYDIRMKYVGLSEEERKKIIHFVFQLERDSINYVKWHRGGEFI